LGLKVNSNRQQALGQLFNFDVVSAKQHNPDDEHELIRLFEPVDANSKIAGVSPVASFAYTYNSANQRMQRAESEGTHWVYSYDSLGQLNSAKKYWPDSAFVPGQQFEKGSEITIDVFSDF
jgi:hypothetical protein